ncbi:MAG: DUF4058 family protein [Planctomycetes bacterium]|nr:DUF4058 family protein [Planctomycetota bacterium]
MPSPFPGMDPYIEDQEWEDFHTRLNTVAGEMLAPIVEPRYVVRVERRVYVAPVECVLPMPQERRETYLVVRDRETLDVVTVVETLSPANKAPGNRGRELYLSKRDEVLQSRSHLVELDLLRGGLRLPALGGLPPGDYYAVVSRRPRRPRADAYAWTVRKALPPIPIPLKDGDPDASLDLQAAFATVYDRACYHLSIDYELPLSLPLSEAAAAWARDVVAGVRR